MERLHLEALDVGGKRVFVRVDFNVPLDGSAIRDDTRIRASVRTLNYLRERGARVICASHLGRPKGKPDPALSLKVVADRLAQLLGTKVGFADDCVGVTAQEAAGRLGDGDVLLLENLRFHAGEEANDGEFAAQLGRLAPLYVNDAFGSSHRAHASIEGITHHVERAAAGYLLDEEVRGLSRAVVAKKWPFALIVGGAKVADKIPVIEGLIDKIDYLLIGGAMALTFIRACGGRVGRSKVEDDKLETASRLLELAERHNVDVSLPVDQIAARSIGDPSSAQTVETDAFPDDLMGLDIGPITALRYSEIIDEARTIIWNGPMGVFEVPAFAEGTLAVARAVADSLAYSVVGGGDSVAALKLAGVEERIGHVSTGGGASLEFLAGATLPGIAALNPATGS